MKFDVIIFVHSDATVKQAYLLSNSLLAFDGLFQRGLVASQDFKSLRMIYCVFFRVFKDSRFHNYFQIRMFAIPNCFIKIKLQTLGFVQRCSTDLTPQAMFL